MLGLVFCIIFLGLYKFMGCPLKTEGVFFQSKFNSMKKLIFVLCLFSCTKIDKEDLVNNNDEDELESNYTEGLETRSVSTFKIVSVITNDSLPVTNARTGEAQKYARRQIVSTKSPTRFFLEGYGFNDFDSSLSYVTAEISDFEIVGLSVFSWSENLVIVDFPVLNYQPAVSKTFSIQFKIWRKNEILGRTNLSRSRVKPCISDVQALTVL
jgi:hypothetical protein